MSCAHLDFLVVASADFLGVFQIPDQVSEGGTTKKRAILYQKPVRSSEMRAQSCLEINCNLPPFQRARLSGSLSFSLLYLRSVCCQIVELAVVHSSPFFHESVVLFQAL